MCKVLNINRSTYYNKLHQIPSKRDLDNQKIDEEIKTIYYETKKRYGAPKIHKTLIVNGKNASLKRVQRRMVYLGSRTIVIKKYPHYSSNKKVVEQKNILKQNFQASGINKKWCTDITYIYTKKDGWTYLASVIDFYSKKIIGWSYGTRMTTELALKAVENACISVKKLERIILHNDLGSQYTSDLFEKHLLKHKIKHSFSRKGCPIVSFTIYVNAYIESFHSLLKKEEVHHKSYIDSKDVYVNIFEYIES